MRIVETSSIPLAGMPLIARTRALATVLIVMVFLGVGVGLFVYAWKETWFALFFAIPAILVGLLLAPLARAAFSKENWLLALDGHGLYIKFRSYQNRHYDAAPVVFRLEHGDVERVRKCILWQTSRGISEDRSGTSKRMVFLEFRLADSTPVPAMEEALRQERGLPAAKAGCGSFKSLDYPVSFSGTGWLRVRWNGVKPSARRALRRLGAYYDVEEPVRIKASAQLCQSQEEFDNHILDLISRGEKMAAIGALRHRHGWSIQEAKRFVDDLDAW